MSIVDGKIVAPVSIDDVKSILGESSNDLATLCKSSKINMWAKYKPTAIPVPFSDNWYKGADGNYGLNITFENAKNNWTDIVAEYSKANNGYINFYIRPTGGSRAPYRLGDFRGYVHDAKPEVKDYLTTNTFIRENDNELYVEHNLLTTDGAQIKYFDFAEFKDKYFGYIITDISKKNLMYITTAANINKFRVSLPKNALQVGDYLVFPMFCSYNYSNNHTLHAMTCYAIPNLVGGKHLSIISQSDAIVNNFAQITAKRTSNKIIVTLKMKDNATTVENVAVYCVYKTIPSKGESMVAGEFMKIVGTINAGETKIVSFDVFSKDRPYTIYVIASGVWVAKRLIPLSDFL